MCLNVVVGTTDPYELEAVKKACQLHGLEVQITGCQAISGVTQQPIGFQETLTGAENRAETARHVHPDDDLWIGIASGVLRARGCHSVGIAVIAVLTKDGTSVFATSPGITFPEDVVRETERRGFGETTVGSVIAERLICDPNDPHAGLTNGRVTRSETLVQGILAALKQLKF